MVVVETKSQIIETGTHDLATAQLTDGASLINGKSIKSCLY